MAKFFVLTDLEGVAGIDSFEHTRTSDQEQKAPAMDQLGREVNACVEGIRDVHPDAEVDVWDGHGSGGLREEDVGAATYLRDGQPYYDLDHDAMLFVGQHAMAGTVNAPLRHTYSSTSVAYYKLDGTYVGEFGCRALLAGLQGVPTVMLTGDDKACLEARMFVPKIETVAVKEGRGEEAAVHMDQSDACEAVREGAASAVDRLDEIEPFAAFDPPYELERRYYDPVSDDRVTAEHVERVDRYTIQESGEDLLDPDDPLYGAL